MLRLISSFAIAVSLFVLTAVVVMGASNGMPKSQLDELVAKALESKDPLPPYALIDMLDQHPAKQNHPAPMWTLVAGPQGSVVWTGSYIPDPLYQGRVVPIIVDGKTGAWLQLPGTTVEWQTAGGSIQLDNSAAPSVLTPAAPQGPATGTVAKSLVVNIINTNKISGTTDLIYVQLDQLVDNNVAARLRASGTATYTVKNTQALIWVKTGEIQGQVLELDQTDGKSLYLITADSVVTVTYAHSGVQVDAPINPANDFVDWWGKP